MAEKNQKKNDILSAAKSLFKEKGFHNTKMDEIAANAGVGKGTLYEYYKNKQDIFDEACIAKIINIKEKIENISNKNITFKQKLIEIFYNKKNSMECEDVTIDGILSYKNNISDNVVKAMMNNISEIYKILEKIIDQGKSEGVVTKDIPSEIIACSVVGTMSEYFRLKLFNNDNKIIEDDVIFNLFFNGFGVK